ncbi:MAG: histidine--tRNA ligase [Oscillospiraceae bacterium]|nr:histidine--tRNA ligase [Oscillospiraceae bacterium]
MANQITRPVGTEDVTPAQMYKWNTVERVVKQAAASFGFSELRVPTFESTDLFCRSVGETTDVVQKEMYTVYGGGQPDPKKPLTLRPEGTAGAIRAMLQNGLLSEALPQKIFYILSCFRHERNQKGRLREFHQFGVEMAGSARPEADAEIILLAKTVLDTLQLKNIQLNINSIGCPTCRAKYTEALKAYFADYREQLCETCQSRLDRNPMRILDCKSPEDQKIAENAPVILDYLCDDCKAHFDTLQSILKAMKVEYVINPKIVRGLDYYSKTVFEFVTTDIGSQSTICGGGRYDGLIQQLGGNPTPALGFGMGLERVIMTMEAQGVEFMQDAPCDVYFAPMDDAARPAAMQLAMALREAGLRAEFDLIGRPFKSQMKYANNIGAKYLLVLGSNELEAGNGKLKNMETGKQEDVRLDTPEHFLEDYTAFSCGLSI